MHENIFHEFIENFLPFVISILEILGILVVVWSAVKAFGEYIQNTFLHKKLNLQYHFAKGLATGLEFKMAGEILNTVLIRKIDELYILGAVILLRALLSILIHFELKETGKDKNKEKAE